MKSVDKIKISIDQFEFVEIINSNDFIKIDLKHIKMSNFNFELNNSICIYKN